MIICLEYYQIIFVACKTSNVDLGNNVLNILNGIKIPLLPESTLYVLSILFWLVFHSSFTKYYRFCIVKLKDI